MAEAKLIVSLVIPLVFISLMSMFASFHLPPLLKAANVALYAMASTRTEGTSWRRNRNCYLIFTSTPFSSDIVSRHWALHDPNDR